HLALSSLALRAALPILSGAAMAADPIGVSTSSSPIAVPVHGQDGFDWGGFYAGIFGGVRNGSVSGSQPTLGIQAGVNAQFDFYRSEEHTSELQSRENLV